MSAIHSVPAQSNYSAKFTSYSNPTQSSDADDNVLAMDQEISQTDVHQCLQRLFTFLQNLNGQVYHRSLRSLVQECEEKGIEYLLQVKELDLACCKLQEIPEEVGLLTNLRSLYLTGNQLTTLPLSLFHLTENLRSLHLGGNQLKNIPETVYRIAMHKIQHKEYFELFLRDNPMKEIPRDLKIVIRSLPHFGSYYVD